MRQYLDETDVAGNIRLLLAEKTYADCIFIVVEGHSDFRLYSKLIKNPGIQIEFITGKPKLVNALQELSRDFPEHVLGICDADFDHIFDLKDDRERISIFLTDYHDTELLMIDSSAAESLITEYTKPEKTEDARNKLVLAAINAAYQIGLLKYINLEKRLFINFKRLGFASFSSISDFDITINEKVLADVLIARSPKLAAGVTRDDLLQEMEEARDTNHCWTQVCNGHDVVKFIALIFQHGDFCFINNCNAERIESTFRAAYQYFDFQKTEVFQKIGGFIDRYLDSYGNRLHS